MNRTMKRMALPIGAALILGSSGFAYMASNVVQTSYMGEGVSDIRGYDVSNIRYETAGGKVTYIDFDADPRGAEPHAGHSDPNYAEISFDNTNWFSCTRTRLDRNSDPEATFMCDLTGEGISALEEDVTVVVTH